MAAVAGSILRLDACQANDAFDVCEDDDLAQILRAGVGAALELIPRAVERELGDLLYGVTQLEEAARGLVPQVVEAQIEDAEDLACVDTLGVARKDVAAQTRLVLNDFPRGRRVLKAQVIAFLVPRVFGVTDSSGAAIRVIVIVFKAAELGFAPRRFDREPHEGAHRDQRSRMSVADGKVLIRFFQLFGRRASVTAFAAGDEAQLLTENSSLGCSE